MRSTVHHIVDRVVQRTGSRDGNFLPQTRGLLDCGVRLHIKPGLGNVHEVGASLLEFPLLFLSFPDRIDIRVKAEKGEAFCRHPRNLLRADGGSTSERGGRQEESDNNRGSKLHDRGVKC